MLLELPMVLLERGGGRRRGEGGEREREAKTKGTEKGRGERGGGGKERVWRKPFVFGISQWRKFRTHA